MDRNRIEGSKHEPKGIVKETFGKTAANPSQRPEDRLGKNPVPKKDAGKPGEQLRREQPHH